MFDPTAAATKLSVPLLCASTASWSSQLPQEKEGETMCLERVSAGSYVGMAAHPDGSRRVFLSTLDGKIWLASMPVGGSGGALHHDGVRPFLDLTDRVRHDAVVGLVGVAFHPEFAANGRFFVSYNCDSRASPACGASRCWGVAGNGSRPCRYQLVVAEFSVAVFSKAALAHPSEVRRILTLGLPQPHTSYSYQQHGGQILFRPSDRGGRYLYFITGHGSSKRTGSLLGKILRFDVGGAPSGIGGERTGRTASHGTLAKMEIVAVGLNNPSGCSFDSGWPFHLYCANVDQQLSEQVYLISDGENYGSFSSNAAFSLVTNHVRPREGRMPSIIGGLLYRGSADPSLKGRYLYMYSSGLWMSGVEVPASRSNRHQIPIVRCSRRSPLPCRSGGTGIIIGGRVLSLGEDNSNDAFILATGGVYRVVPTDHCAPLGQGPSTEMGWLFSEGTAVVLLFVFYLIWSSLCSGGSPLLSCFNGWFTTRDVTTNHRRD